MTTEQTRDRRQVTPTHYIVIDGEVCEVTDTFEGGYLPLLEIGGMEYYVAESTEAAGAAAREYWVDMATNDPEEFVAIVDQDALVAWGLGQYYAPGSVAVSSLEEWLDLTATVPEEQWAYYDHTELDVRRVSEDLIDELGFVPTVAYRAN